MAKQAIEKTNSANDIHIVLAAKGGIGKTYLAGLFVQYANHRGSPMKALDLDQSNAMLARIPSLKADRVVLLSDARFDAAKMDTLVKRMVEEPGPYILDVGASTYQDVWRYFTKYQMFDGLKAQGRRVIIHTVIVGGPEFPDTLNSFVDAAQSVPDKQVVVWINPLRGPVTHDGKSFEQMSVLATHEDKVLGVVNLPQADEATLADLQKMALNLETLTTMESSTALEFFSKHRLAVHREQLFEQMGGVWEAIGGQPSQSQGA